MRLNSLFSGYMDDSMFLIDIDQLMIQVQRLEFIHLSCLASLLTSLAMWLKTTHTMDFN